MVYLSFVRGGLIVQVDCYFTTFRLVWNVDLVNVEGRCRKCRQ